jgi:hypothetical protein
MPTIEVVINDMLAGEYKNPVRVVAFNTAEKMVSGCIGRRGAGAAPALRSANAGSALRPATVR